MSEHKITAYKAFNADWTCRDFRYQVGQTYQHDGDIEMCSAGFHACEVPFDCWTYYEGSMTFAKVDLSGVSDVRTEDSKRVAASITISASLSLPEWIKEQVRVVVGLCKAATGRLASDKEECAAATGFSGHAAATGYRGRAAATGYRGHAAATGFSGHAAATGYSGHAAATGFGGHAAATGDSGHAAATGDSGRAAATGYSGHAVATGYSGHAAATGYRGHAAATGYRGHAAVQGKSAIAASLGVFGTARAEEGGAIVLAAYDESFNLVAVRAALVGQDGIEAGKTYRLLPAGEFQVIE